MKVENKREGKGSREISQDSKSQIMAKVPDSELRFFCRGDGVVKWLR